MLVTLVTSRIAGLRAWRALLLLLAAGCGQTRGAGNSGEPTPVTEVPLAEGTCGVVRAIPIPNPTDAFGSEAGVARYEGGFSLGPWNEDERVVGSLLIDEATGQQHDFTAQGSTNDRHWSAMLASTSTAVEVHVGGPAENGESAFGVRALSEGATDAEERGTLLHASWRGTDFVAASAALDGQSAVFAIWPFGISGPRAGLIGPDGTAIGEPRALAPNDHLFGRCPALTPTQHGAVVSFVDDADHTLHLVELSATGAPRIDVSQPFPADQTRCPLLALDDAGVSILMPDSEDAGEYAFFHVDAAGLSVLPSLTLKARPLAFATTPRGTLVLEQGAGSAQQVELVGDDRAFSLGDAPVVTRAIPSEPGRLFLDTERGLEWQREIVEIACR